MIRPARAVLLGAGLGTRIRPLSHDLPKPMMPVEGVPVVERIIRMLAGWGVREFLVNLHHNPQPLVLHLRDLALRQGLRIDMSFEPTLLDTGGALRRAQWFLDDHRFWLVNTDILSDVDPAPLLRQASRGNPLAALWVTDTAGPRTVEVGDSRVVTFRSQQAGTPGTFTFCGLHLLSPRVLDFIPKDQAPYSIVTAYERAMAQGEAIVATQVPGSCWADLGSPDGYRAVHAGGWKARDARIHKHASVRGSVVWPGAVLGPRACIESAVVGRGVHLDRSATGIVIRADCLPTDDPLRGAINALKWGVNDVVLEALPARGSDRTFTRLVCGGRSVVVVQHGGKRSENDVYAAHARLLLSRGVPVPRILFDWQEDRLIVMEDAGDRSLERALPGWTPSTALRRYKQVLDSLLTLHAIPETVAGRLRLQPPFNAGLYRWERDLMDDHFLRETLQLSGSTRSDVMRDLATVARQFGHTPHGLVHRDMQSSNVLIQRRGHMIIDFQGMRWGPVAYDVASLLCDPYAMLNEGMQQRLLAYYIGRHREGAQVGDVFWYAAIQRLSQALGAYGRLSVLPGMARFADYIPPALEMMNRALAHVSGLPALRALAAGG